MTSKTNYAFLRLVFSAVIPSFLMVVFGAYFIIPNSHWFEVKTVFVENSVVGVPPKMVVSRKVNSPFVGRWIANVKRIDAAPTTERTITVDVTTGSPAEPDTAITTQLRSAVTETPYSITCTATSRNSYKVGTDMPPDLTLNWWTFPVECNLPVGTYVVETEWTFTTLFMDRTVEATSNVFQIKPTHVIQ